MERKLLGSSLVISKLAYCLEITTMGPKSNLATARNLLNNLALTVCNEWDYEWTQYCYQSLGLCTIDQLVVHKTYTMARKIIEQGDPINIIRTFAERRNNEWKIKKPTLCRTDIGRRRFSQQIMRLWEVLPDELKIIDMKQQKSKLELHKILEESQYKLDSLQWNNQT